MHRTFTFLLFSIFFCISAFGQDRALKKANEFFKNEEYAAAMPLYEEVLAEQDSRIAKTKLAYCYKMNNLLAEAENLYQELVEDEHTPAITMFYYGEALMSNEKYDEAKSWFEKFLLEQPDSKNAPLLIKACKEVKNIHPYYDKILVEEFPQNSTADDNGPVFWQDKIVFTSDRKSGLQLLKKKSGTTGRDFLKLYASTKAPDGSWSEVEALDKLNEVNKNTANAAFDTVDNKVYYTKNASTLNKQNTYNLQLFTASFDEDGSFKNTQKVDFCNLGSNYMHPAISPDGKRLFYVADRSIGEGGTDIYVSIKKSNGEWATGKNLGAPINTPANEGFPFIDNAGNLYFCSKGHTGYGGFDIFVSKPNKDGTWSSPVNLGKPINSAMDDISICINQDGKEGLFTSARKGGDDDIYLFYLDQESPTFPLADQGTPEDLLKEEDNAGLKEQKIEEEKISFQYYPDDKKPVATVQNEQSSPSDNEDLGLNKEKSKVEEETKEELKELPATSDILSNNEEVVTNEDAEIEKPILEVVPSKEKKEVTTLEEPGLEQKKEENKIAKLPLTEKELKDQQATIPAQMEVTPPEARNVNFGSSTEEGTSSLNERDLVRNAWNKKLVSGQQFLLSAIKFNVGTTALNSVNKIELNKLVDFLKQYPEVSMEIGCHTITLYDSQENLHKSQLRAENIVAYLIEQGIVPERLTAKGYGSDQPINDCQTIEDCPIKQHLINQRLELKVLAVDY